MVPTTITYLGNVAYCCDNLFGRCSLVPVICSHDYLTLIKKFELLGSSVERKGVVGESLTSGLVCEGPLGYAVCKGMPACRILHQLSSQV